MLFTLQLLSTLDHPNIIAYKECFVDSDESLCIVTSFCEEVSAATPACRQKAAGFATCLMMSVGFPSG